MDVPATFAQLTIALLFVVPGFVYQAVRQRVRGPSPEDINFSDKLFRALGVGTGLMAIYLAVAGSWILRLTERRHDHVPSWQGAQQHVTALAWLAVLLLLVIPAMLALAGYFWTIKQISLRGITYSPVPRAWDYTFTDLDPCFVRVLTNDGVWLGGWFGPR